MPDDNTIIEQQLRALEESIGNVGENSQQLREEIANLKREYEDKRDNANTPEKKKEFADYAKALVGSLPDITKGTLAAITAFREQPPDVIGGSAAIMDILSGVSSSLGPEGAALGAVFSMVSMILHFFVPKQPDMLTEFKKIFDNVQAHSFLDDLKTIVRQVDFFAQVCEDYITKPPTADDKFQHNNVRGPGPLTDEITSMNLLGTAALTIFKAQDWLLDPAHQDTDDWPEILAIHCEAYMRLRTAIMRQYMYAYDKDGKFDKDGKKEGGGGVAPFKTRSEWYIDKPNDPKGERELLWYKLQSQIKPKFDTMVKEDNYAKGFVTDVVKLARKRGLHIIHWDNADMNLISGPTAFDPPGRSDKLREHCHRMAIVPPRGGVTDPKADYEVWVMDSEVREFHHHTINLQARKLGSQSVAVGIEGWVAGFAKGFFDCWPVPRPGPGNKFSVFLAVDSSWKQLSGGQVQLYEWDKDTNTFTHEQGWQANTAEWVVQVRVAKRAAPFPDDPDKAALPPTLIGSEILYGTFLNSKNIFAWFNNAPHNVPIPMGSYTGIAVDRNFLWVYGSEGFACATHASVLSYLNGTRTGMPRWLGNGKDRNIYPVQDLSSCEDGTLFAVLPDRGVAAPYHVAFGAPGGEGKWLIIDEDWTTLPAASGGVAQCQKLPIFGWPRVEALAALLRKQKTK